MHRGKLPRKGDLLRVCIRLRALISCSHGDADFTDLKKLL